MMSHSKTQLGFSLIELMVVMAIMAVLLTLSGGLLQKSINQQTRQVELERVKQLFQQLSYQAYYGGKPIQVSLEKKSIFISLENHAPTNEDILTKELVFEELLFVAQHYNISAKGIVSPNKFSFFLQNNIKHILVEPIFDEITTH